MTLRASGGAPGAKPAERQAQGGAQGIFVKNLIKDATRAVVLDPEIIDAVRGHSLRGWAAQDLLTHGHDAIAIMRAGGWKSINVLARYLEFAEHNVWETAPLPRAD